MKDSCIPDKAPRPAWRAGRWLRDPRSEDAPPGESLVITRVDRERRTLTLSRCPEPLSQEKP